MALTNPLIYSCAACSQLLRFKTNKPPEGQLCPLCGKAQITFVREDVAPLPVPVPVPPPVVPVDEQVPPGAMSMVGMTEPTFDEQLGQAHMEGYMEGMKAGFSEGYAQGFHIGLHTSLNGSPRDVDIPPA